MKLFIGNLSFNTTEETLKERFDTTTDCKVVTDRETGRSRGFAFLTFSTRDHAINAIESHNNTELDGRTIFVSEAKERTTSRPSPQVYRRESNEYR